MNVDTLARALEARRSGPSWMAKCPAHEDRNPSLSIREVDGKVLLHCHAGCTQRDVIDALKARGLWRPELTENPRIVATYDYTDEQGNLLYQVVRYQPKDFKQRRPDGCGGWTWKKSARQVLYRLPEVLEAPIVFVEKASGTSRRSASTALWQPPTPAGPKRIGRHSIPNLSEGAR
jgi:putative DNA primase/helicase